MAFLARADWRLFAAVFGVTFVAELPDKTALAALLLASRRQPLAVFWGAAAAFAVHTLVAVFFGGLLSLISARFVHFGAGLLFLGMAALLWLRPEPREEELRLAAEGKREDFFKTARLSFAAIFVAEWGDLTQFSTAALEAKFRSPGTIFVSATLALWAVTALAVAIGHRSKRYVHPAALQRAAAGVFALVGAALLLGASP